MSDNEFLSPPPWRNRTSSKQRRKAIGLSFSAYVALGAGLLWLALRLLDAIDAPGWLTLAAWLLPTAITTGWAVRTTTAGLVAERESQSWSEYVIRSVMVGSEQPRPRLKRVATGIVFGGPIAYATIVLVALLLIGFG